MKVCPVLRDAVVQIVILLINCFFQVLEMESTNVKALYRRAQAYIQLADFDLAELDIKRALEIDPNNRYQFASSFFMALVYCVILFAENWYC